MAITSKSRKRRKRLAKATTVTLSATLSIMVSPAVAAKISAADSTAERIAVIRFAVSDGNILRKDGSPLSADELRKVLAQTPWGDYGWNKRFDDGRV